MWNSVHKWEVDEVLKRINELERMRRLLNSDESIELGALRQRLEKLRSDCSHDFKVETLFHAAKMICQTCYLEDKTYNHFRDKK